MVPLKKEERMTSICAGGEGGHHLEIESDLPSRQAASGLGQK